MSLLTAQVVRVAWMLVRVRISGMHVVGAVKGLADVARS